MSSNELHFLVSINPNIQQFDDASQSSTSICISLQMSLLDDGNRWAVESESDFAPVSHKKSVKKTGYGNKPVLIINLQVYAWDPVEMLNPPAISLKRTPSTFIGIDFFNFLLLVFPET